MYEQCPMCGENGPTIKKTVKNGEWVLEPFDEHVTHACFDWDEKYLDVYAHIE